MQSQFPKLHLTQDVLQRLPLHTAPHEPPELLFLRLDQRPIVITYNVRRSPEALRDHVQESYGTEPVPEADGERLVFRSNRADGDGLFRVTVVYAAHPFAVTVEAPDRRLRDDALGELVDFRPADEVLVRQD